MFIIFVACVILFEILVTYSRQATLFITGVDLDKTD